MQEEILIQTFILGITGASGSIYGIRLLSKLLTRETKIYLTITEAGKKVINHELGLDLGNDEQVKDKILNFVKENKIQENKDNINFVYLPIDEIDASIASGSFLLDAMAVVPCSMATLSGITYGRSKNLLERAADVTLKEEKKLIVVPREMPLNSIQLDNMLKLSKVGGTIIPAMPGFYHNPETVDDLIDHVVGKILDNLGVKNNLFRRWE